MSSTMELDESKWQFFKDADQKIEHTAEEALRQIGWDATMAWTRRALLRGSGAVSGECIEVWCVKLSGVEPEFRICRSFHDFHEPAEMTAKFAAKFEEFRSGL